MTKSAAAARAETATPKGGTHHIWETAALTRKHIKTTFKNGQKNDLKSGRGQYYFLLLTILDILSS